MGFLNNEVLDKKLFENFFDHSFWVVYFLFISCGPMERFATYSFFVILSEVTRCCLMKYIKNDSFFR